LKALPLPGSDRPDGVFPPPELTDLGLR